MRFDELINAMQKEQEERAEQLEEQKAKFEALERTYPYRVDVCKTYSILPIFFETLPELAAFSAKLDAMFEEGVLTFKRVKTAEQITKGLPFIDVFIPINETVNKVEVFGLHD